VIFVCVQFDLLFQLTIEQKIEIIAKKIYGADGIELEPLAQEQVNRYKRQVSTMVIFGKLG